MSIHIPRLCQSTRDSDMLHYYYHLFSVPLFYLPISLLFQLISKSSTYFIFLATWSRIIIVHWRACICMLQVQVGELNEVMVAQTIFLTSYHCILTFLANARLCYNKLSCSLSFCFSIKNVNNRENLLVKYYTVDFHVFLENTFRHVFDSHDRRMFLRC